MPFFRSVLKQDTGGGGGGGGHEFQCKIGENYYGGGKCTGLLGADSNRGNFNLPIAIGNNVIETTGMLSGCYNYNCPIHIPGSVISASNMFNCCNHFNSPITFDDNFIGANLLGLEWKITTLSSEVNYVSLFNGCVLLNQPINFPVDVTCESLFNYRPSTINCVNLFRGCRNLNSPIRLPSHLSDNLYYRSMGQGDNYSQCFAVCLSFNQDVYLDKYAGNLAYMLQQCNNFSANVYIKGHNNIDTNGGTFGLPTVNAAGMFFACNNSKRKNVWFNALLDNKFGITNTMSIVGAAITWTTMTNGYYNATYNVYCYNNYSG